LCSLPFAFAQTITERPKATKSHQSRHIPVKDDIEAIGMRNVGGHRFGDWYSVEREIEMGREYAKTIDGTSQFEKDTVVNEYVNQIGQSLVRNSDAKVPFTIKVIESDDINAYALPGGFLYVNTGLILAAQDEAELAAVMAHEIAHVAARHATRQMTRSQMLNLASIPLVMVGGPAGMALQQAAKIATPLSMTKFSRGFEAEADHLGVEYLYKAGYDPQAFISFFERIKIVRKREQSAISKAFSTHPQTADRIRKTQKEIQTILPSRDKYVVSSSEFEEVKARLSTAANRRNSEATRPTLRRRPAANSDGP
jgi:beta-barrel assembly-enhancing protease